MNISKTMDLVDMEKFKGMFHEFKKTINDTIVKKAYCVLKRREKYDGVEQQNFYDKASLSDQNTIKKTVAGSVLSRENPEKQIRVKGLASIQLLDSLSNPKSNSFMGRLKFVSEGGVDLLVKTALGDTIHLLYDMDVNVSVDIDTHESGRDVFLHGTIFSIHRKKDTVFLLRIKKNANNKEFNEMVRLLRFAQKTEQTAVVNEQGGIPVDEKILNRHLGDTILGQLCM